MYKELQKQLTKLRGRVNLMEPQVDHDADANVEQNANLDDIGEASVELAALADDNSAQVAELQDAIVELAELIK